MTGCRYRVRLVLRQFEQRESPDFETVRLMVRAPIGRPGPALSLGNRFRFLLCFFIRPERDRSGPRGLHAQSFDERRSSKLGVVGRVVD